MSTDDNEPAALALIDGLLARMDRESAKALGESTAALVAKLRGRPIPDDVRVQLEQLATQLAAELRTWWSEKQRVERELAEWIARKDEAHAAQRDALVADARERADELISIISELEATCTDLQRDLRALEQLLQSK